MAARALLHLRSVPAVGLVGSSVGVPAARSTAAAVDDDQAEVPEEGPIAVVEKHPDYAADDPEADLVADPTDQAEVVAASCLEEAPEEVPIAAAGVVVGVRSRPGAAAGRMDSGCMTFAEFKGIVVGNEYQKDHKVN